MKKRRKALFVLICGVFAASVCAQASHHNSNHHEHNCTYECISQEDAHAVFEEEEDVCILDVREPEEYEEGHIPGAILIPLGEIETQCGEMLPGKDADIYVYCRSGRRSKAASQILADLGYVHIHEFGGMIDWTYETETGAYEPEEALGVDEGETDVCEINQCEADKSKTDQCEADPCETEDCHHEWIEDCISKTCSKCGEYHRVTP